MGRVLFKPTIKEKMRERLRERERESIWRGSRVLNFCRFSPAENPRIVLVFKKASAKVSEDATDAGTTPHDIVDVAQANATAAGYKKKPSVVKFEYSPKKKIKAC